MIDVFDREAWALAPDVLHLNHGSFGAVPHAVRAAQDDWKDIIESNPTGFLSRRLVEELDTVRHAAAVFLHADPRGLVFLPNVTWAAAMVLTSVPVGPGDEILISDDTYQGVRAAVQEACASAGARLVQAQVPSGNFADGEAVTHAVERALTPRTKLAIIDHITSPTAALIDPTPTVQRCHANGTAVLIDGAHAPGMLAVDVDLCGADFYAGVFHKWCCAPLGTGFLAVAPQWRDRMHSPAPGSESDQGFPTGLEWSGTTDFSGTPGNPNRPQSPELRRCRQSARAQRGSRECRRRDGGEGHQPGAPGTKPDCDGDARVAVASVDGCSGLSRSASARRDRAQGGGCYRPRARTNGAALIGAGVQPRG